MTASPYPDPAPDAERGDLPARIAALRPDDLAGRALLAAAGLHLVLALAFILSLAGASRALSQDSCSGENLVERLARDDPARLAQAIAEADAIANGQGMLWKVTKPGLEPSFLFGTMHSADPRIARLRGPVEAAFAASRTVIIESVDTLDPRKMASAIVEMKELTLLTDGTTLEGYVPTDRHAALRTLLAARGMQWDVARHMQPWLVAAAIAIPACETAIQNTGAVVLDTLIGNRARAEGKELVGLETVGEQFAAIAGVPRDFHVNALVETLEMGDLADSVMESTKLLYLDGNTALMLPLIRAYARKTYSGPAYEDFRERLIAGRNETMAARAGPYLEKGGVFMAVGALHLPGERGLVSLLRARGFDVEGVPLD